MGQKVHPIGFRLGYTETWDSRWFDKKDYAVRLHEDLFIKKHIRRSLAHAGISRVLLERKGEKVIVTIYTARPGIIIGKRGGEVDRLRDAIQKAVNKPVSINIQEIKNPETDAQLVAENVAAQLLKRVAFRRAMKKAVSVAMSKGALGIKIRASGRLDGGEMARTEWYREGRVPLQTLRADINYGTAEAKTVSGLVGIKVWIFHGEKIETVRRVKAPVAEASESESVAAGVGNPGDAVTAGSVEDKA